MMHTIEKPLSATSCVAAALFRSALLVVVLMCIVVACRAVGAESVSKVDLESAIEQRVQSVMQKSVCGPLDDQSQKRIALRSRELAAAAGRLPGDTVPADLAGWIEDSFALEASAMGGLPAQDTPEARRAVAALRERAAKRMSELTETRISAILVLRASAVANEASYQRSCREFAARALAGATSFSVALPSGDTATGLPEAFGALQTLNTARGPAPLQKDFTGSLLESRLLTDVLICEIRSGLEEHKAALVEGRAGDLFSSLYDSGAAAPPTAALADFQSVFHRAVQVRGSRVCILLSMLCTALVGAKSGTRGPVGGDGVTITFSNVPGEWAFLEDAG